MLNDLIGKPFKDRGRGEDGYDCWGLVLEVFKRYGINLPDFDISAYAHKMVAKKVDEEKNKSCWKKLDKPEVPSICIFGKGGFVHHLGVYIGNGKFIHSLIGKGVQIDRLSSPIWKKQLLGFYKYDGNET